MLWKPNNMHQNKQDSLRVFVPIQVKVCKQNDIIKNHTCIHYNQITSITKVKSVLISLQANNMMIINSSCMNNWELPEDEVLINEWRVCKYIHCVRRKETISNPEFVTSINLTFSFTYSFFFSFYSHFLYFYIHFLSACVSQHALYPFFFFFTITLLTMLIGALCPLSWPLSRNFFTCCIILPHPPW